MRPSVALAAAAIATVVAVVLTGCTTGGAGGGASAPDPASAPTSALPAGFYGIPVSSVRHSGDRYVFSLPTSCADGIAFLDSGQWRETVLLTAQGALQSWMVALSLDGTSALLQLIPQSGLCEGVLTTSRTEPVTVTGSEKARGAARFLAFSCVHTKPGEKGDTVTLTGLYDLGKDLHLQIQATFAAGSGRHPVSRDDVGVQLAHGPRTMLDLYGELFAAAAAASAGGDDSGDGIDVSAFGDAYTASSGFAGTASLEKGSAVAGTITLHGIAAGGKSIAVTAGFRCAS